MLLHYKIIFEKLRTEDHFSRFCLERLEQSLLQRRLPRGQERRSKNQLLELKISHFPFRQEESEPFFRINLTSGSLFRKAISVVTGSCHNFRLKRNYTFFRNLNNLYRSSS